MNKIMFLNRRVTKIGILNTNLGFNIELKRVLRGSGYSYDSKVLG